MKNLDNYYLWQIAARIDPSRVADLHWKIPEEAISRINSWSFLSSHGIATLVINIEQYYKEMSGCKTGEPWICVVGK